jgi:hypothetical protein
VDRRSDDCRLAGAQADEPSGQARYSDLAIQLVLMLRLVFHLALRQAEAFAGSVLRLLGLDLFIPDHTTLSRRSRKFSGRRPHAVSHDPVHLVIDSTGLKLFGQGEWNEEKHGRTRRSWRKLHLALDGETSEIVATVLTGNDLDDAGQTPVLLEQVDAEIASVTADGAYDGEPVYQAVASRQPDKPPDVIIPPRSSAAPGASTGNAPSQRDRHIRAIAEKGRMAWQKATGYGRRSLIETAIGRYKSIIGSRLRARTFAAQQEKSRLPLRRSNG